MSRCCSAVSCSCKCLDYIILNFTASTVWTNEKKTLFVSGKTLQCDLFMRWQSLKATETQCLTSKELSFRLNQQWDFSAAYEKQAAAAHSVEGHTVTLPRAVPAATAWMDTVDETRIWDVIGCPELVGSCKP